MKLPDIRKCDTKICDRAIMERWLYSGLSSEDPQSEDVDVRAGVYFQAYSYNHSDSYNQANELSNRMI